MGVVTLAGYVPVRDQFSKFDDATILRKGIDVSLCANGTTQK